MRHSKRLLPTLALLLIIVVMAAGCAQGTVATNPGWTVVTAQDDVIYAALSTGTVVALDALTGEQVWAYPPPTAQPGGLFARRDPTAPQPLSAVYGQPVVVGDLLLVASLDHNVYAFDRQTGLIAWKYDVGQPVAGSMAVRDGVAYFGANDNHVYALNLETQEVTWSEPFETGHWVWGRPAVDEERIYFGSMDHSVYALERATGTRVWSYDTGGALAGGVVLDGGLVFAGTVNKQFYALDAETGNLVWVSSLSHWVMGDPLVSDGYVYFTTLDGRVHSLSVVDGSPRWEPPSVLKPVRAGPCMYGDQLLVATDAGELWRVSTETGEARRIYPDIGELGSPSALGAMLSEPVVLGDIVYVGTASGYVLAADTTAQIQPEVWIYQPLG